MASIQEIATLVFVNGLGSLLALLVPSYIIGLFGIVPIAIGIMKIKQSRKGNDSQKQKVQVNKLSYLSSSSVAAITNSNGGDNIGLNTPLFATYRSPNEVMMFIIVFMFTTAFWCAIGNYLVKRP